MLHYFAKSFFAKIIVTGHKTIEGQIQLYTVNDQLSPVEDVSVLVQIYNYDSPEFRPVDEYRLNTSLVSQGPVLWARWTLIVLSANILKSDVKENQVSS